MFLRKISRSMAGIFRCWYSNKPALPLLPVPELDATLENYLKALEPVIQSQDEFLEASKLVEEFRVLQGPSLQKLLKKRAGNMDNWLFDWWTKYAYLEGRESLVNSNTALVFPFMKRFESVEEHVGYAAKVVKASLEFHRLIEDGKLESDMIRSEEMCMTQYKRMFASCRVPGKKVDLFNSNESESKRSEIIVLANNTIYLLDLARNSSDHSGVFISEEEIFTELHNIWKESEAKPTAIPINIMTAADRDVWYKFHKGLRKFGKHNKYILEKIENSLFVLCLDYEQQPTGSKTLQMQAAEEILHGGTHSQNRWMDKTIQIIIGRNGVSGVCNEHTGGEATVPVRLMDFIIDSVEPAKNAHYKPKITEPGLRRKRLEFQLKPDLIELLMEEEKKFDLKKQNLELNLIKFKEFGKSELKSLKVSPDAFFQIALQLAFYRLCHTYFSTYETASTRKFHLGRTETIRTGTKASFEFVQSMVKNQTPQSPELLTQAIEEHRLQTTRCMEGHGIDRHLFGLKRVAEENHLQPPPFLSHSAHKKFSHFRLSTSQISFKYDSYPLYVPLTTNGYGLTYNIMNNQINFGLSRYASAQDLVSTDHFGEMVHNSLCDMRNILQK